MQVIPNEIYTLKETEEILKLSRSTILRLIKKSELKTVKIGRQHRILGREILKMVRYIEN
ncbi:MAG: helix-turn-helix domain-containing protein [Candidatus Omnitrophica bacterium]|jgi:predicted DNA-binding transcriptional regulator AlpA|nr:helix-turn-helix domain-containing protein [Candidatus Omnitrophota bacterium]